MNSIAFWVAPRGEGDRTNVNVGDQVGTGHGAADADYYGFFTVVQSNEEWSSVDFVVK